MTLLELNIEISKLKGYEVRHIYNDQVLIGKKGKDGFWMDWLAELDKIEVRTPKGYIVKFCDNLKQSLLDKYEKGEAEHGSNWQGVDCSKEIAEEIKDIINYHAIHMAQKGEIK